MIAKPLCISAVSRDILLIQLEIVWPPMVLIVIYNVITGAPCQLCWDFVNVIVCQHSIRFVIEIAEMMRPLSRILMAHM